MATNSPTAVATRASEMPAITADGFDPDAARPVFAAELVRVRAARPRHRIEELRIDDGRLEARDRRAAERGVPGNGKGGERLVRHAAQADRPGEVLAQAGSLVDELPAQIHDAELVVQARAENVRVGAEQVANEAGRRC